MISKKNKAVSVFWTILFLIPILLMGQESPMIFVKYNKSVGNVSDYKERLFANEMKAISIRDSLYRPTREPSAAQDENTGNAIAITKGSMGGTIKEEIVIKKADGPILQHQYYFEDVGYLITDSMPEMDWELIDGERKQIGNYDCHKARLLDFRGYSVIAYYTPEIPIPFGPWKFKGLPGLILEVQQEHFPSPSIWTLEEIVFPYEEPVHFTIANTSLMPVSIKEFIRIADKKRQDDWAVKRSRIPKEARVGDVQLFRPNLEQRFEWETQ